MEGPFPVERPFALHLHLMRDLFDTPLLPGLATADDLVTRAEERDLVDAIDALDLQPFRFQGWEGKRLTHSFGLHYDFDNGALAVTDPIPAWLAPFRDRAARFAGLPPGTLRQALLIRYDPGAGIGWHRDRPHFEHVVGISLGAPAELRFRRRTETGFARRTVPLPARGVYHLHGEARHAWEHSIAPMAATRWSITLRSVSARGQQAIGPA